MNTAAILSIKPRYANQILAGTKKIELRKSSMGLGDGDAVLVYASAPEQTLKFWFRVSIVETLPVLEMWCRHHDRLGIEYDDFSAYFSESTNAVGLHVGEIHPLRPISLRMLEQLVPGFVPPQGLIWLKDDFGRYQRLLAELSFPLPQDLFPQQRLALDLALPATPAE